MTTYNLSGLTYNMAAGQEQCINAFIQRGENPYPTDKGEPWCNATFDMVLCWPAVKGNDTVRLPCPPLKGLDPTKQVKRWCLPDGRWQGTHREKPNGWTNYTVCMKPSVLDILDKLSEEALIQAQEIARGTRKVEFVGLGLSFLSLTCAVLIFLCFRRLRVFRNQIHLQLMIALLLVVIVRLVLYIDLIVTEQLGNLKTTDVGATINTKPILCEAFYFLLEYFKTVTFAWMFIEGFYLHNQVVVTVFGGEPRFWRYMFVGWGFPLIHTTIWLAMVMILSGKVDRCLGSYYLNPEFWVLDGLRMWELVVNTFFLLNIVRVLWLKVRESHSATELEQLKMWLLRKSVKAALMLVPLLGIPNIMQTIPFHPTESNIEYFAVFTYIASIFYMFQGFMIAIIYCFTNREVIHVLKQSYQRYQLQHANSDTLRRGSRAPSVFYQCSRNGQVAQGGSQRIDTPLLTKANASYTSPHQIQPPASYSPHQIQQASSAPSEPSEPSETPSVPPSQWQINDKPFLSPPPAYSECINSSTSHVVLNGESVAV